MRLFQRRETPPTELLALLDKGERVVSWADTSSGAVVAATQHGLWWPEAGGPRLIGWQSVTKASWRDDVLSVIEADVVDDLLTVDRPAVAVGLSTPRDLPPTVRKRVEANIVSSELVTIPGGAARFIARRIPGQDGVQWWARLEAGAPDTAQVRSALAARLAILRSEWDKQVS